MEWVCAFPLNILVYCFVSVLTCSPKMKKENIFMKGPKPDQRTMLYFLRVCLHKCVLEYSQSVKE